MRRIGIDVGGTFTDVVMYDEDTGAVWSTKVPTTPRDPTVGAIDGLEAIMAIGGAGAADIAFIGHGTTIATNMVIEGQGARTALLTTKGFRDILELRRGWRHDRADLYDLFFEAPRELVPRHLRREIDERVLYDGTIAKAVDPAELDARMAELEADGVEALAVCFLNSPVNGDNERDALRGVRARGSGMFISGSIEVNPEIMEYERTCTTVVNAMLGPRCGQYAGEFLRKTRALGIGADVYFMQSNGGLTPPESVNDRPVALLESGPAGGVTAVARLCERMGIANALAGDMGGTSFDVSLVRDFRPEMRGSTMLNTYTIRAPNIDIVSIGAGGGSIAWIDAGGGIRVGPQSAGADPGPACYGRGGDRPTVTDCNLILGHVDAQSFLGGEFRLDVEAARRAVEDHLAIPLGIGVEEAALAVRRIANAVMAQAMRLITVERGYDPREFVYIPYGGAGPVHAVELARDLEIPQVVLPPLPGVFSAFGMLVSDVVEDVQGPVNRNAADIEPAAFAAQLAELEEQARSRLRLEGTGKGEVVVSVERFADCCYLGQGESMLVEVPADAARAGKVEQIARNFVEAHQRQWNFSLTGRPVRIVNLRVRAIARIGSLASTTGERRPAGSPQPAGAARIRADDGWMEMPRYRRDALRAGDRIAGPAVIEEPSTRIAIYRGDALEVADDLSIVVNVGRAGR
jgi:N-methylhydantoinase A